MGSALGSRGSREGGDGRCIEQLLGERIAALHLPIPLFDKRRVKCYPCCRKRFLITCQPVSRCVPSLWPVDKGNAAVAQSNQMLDGQGGACAVIGVAHCPGVLAKLRAGGFDAAQWS
jgi:hypothetical protein